MSTKECLQQITGSCLGCDIYGMAETKSNENHDNASIITKRIRRTYCPDGTTMRPVEIRKRNKVWIS